MWVFILPLRDYKCEDCNEVWESLRRDQSDPEKCTKCDSINIKRLPPISTGFILKGKGWYATDFKK